MSGSTRWTSICGWSWLYERYDGPEATAARSEVPWDDLPLGVPGLGQVKDREIVEALSRVGYSITIGAVKAARKRRGVPSWRSTQKAEQK